MPPVVVAFIADLMFQTRAESAAQQLGYQVYWIESLQQLEARNAELLTALGTEGLLVDQITRLGPQLLVFDLGNAEIPWEHWIPSLKTIPATRRIPLICFGSHVEVDTLQKARQAGADAVVARSRFVTALPELIKKYARQNDAEVLTETCAQLLHPKAIKGLVLFNEGDYFEAHEWLEKAWMDDSSLGRDLYRGVLQIAVAYFHVRRQNYRGAVKMFQRARYWLDPLPAVCRGVAVEALRADAEVVYDQVLALGPERLEAFETDLLKPVHWSNSDSGGTG